ncbi:hypothetical protein ACFWN2_22160 [Lentzea sp. NPDC058436]|uniref:hypothetical protein n=1 Tax=Lentzea sp. NPDC058436 TaxID=3346499 RepID=UPI003651E52D
MTHDAVGRDGKGENVAKPVFMSQQHVDLMNEILAADEESRAECAKLDRAHWMVYELEDGDRVVWWTVEFDPGRGVRFGLRPPPADAPALLYRGDHRAVVEATRQGKREGGGDAPPVTTHGDPEVLTTIAPAFAAARRAATIPSEFPDF